MRGKSIILAAWCLLACTGNLLKAADRTNIAILDLESKAVSKMEASSITDELRSQIIKTDLFNVIERSRMNEIMAEQGLQSSDLCSSEECYVEMGQIMGVEKLVVGNIGKVGEIFILSIRMIDVKSGRISIDINDKYKGSVEDVLIVLVPRVVGKLQEEAEGKAGAVPKGSLTVTSPVKGAEVVIDGKVAGKVPLSNVSLATGSHTVIVRKNGYVPEKQVLVIGQKKEHKELQVVLVPKKAVDALWRSAAAPGWGQVYNEQKWKGLAIGSLQTICLAGAVIVQLGYRASYDDYQAALVEYNTAVSGFSALRDKVVSARDDAEAKDRLSTVLWAGCGLVYLANLADVFFLRPAYPAAGSGAVPPKAQSLDFRMHPEESGGVALVAEVTF